MQKYQFLGLLCLLLASCARLDPTLRTSFADEFAGQHGFNPVSWSVSGFDLKGYQRLKANEANDLVVYIEGDGLAYHRRHRPSNNPTPIKAFTLQLAAQDPHPHVLYLARPCQYLNENELSGCERKFWTSHRYSETVIQAYEQLLDQLKQTYPIQHFKLIGYSGGGVIATLLAARRNDIESILTVATNLDLRAWTDHHGLAAMNASLNPTSFTDQLTSVRQRHLVGEDDDIVPPLVLHSYLEALAEPNDSEFQVVADYDHHCCWRDDWPTWLQWFYK